MNARKKLKVSVDNMSFWKRQLKKDNYEHFVRMKELFLEHR
jgi:hypothetical protein